MIIKRDGTIQKFDINKVVNAIHKALLSNNLDDITLAEHIAKDIDFSEAYTVEDIQDLVEQALMETGLYPAARNYITYRNLHNTIRQQAQANIDFIHRFIDSDNTANATIDDNSNVNTHNIAVLNSEIHKENNQITNLQILENKIKELYPDFDYKQMKKDFNTIAYLHDSSSQIGMPYCVAVTMYPFLLNGIKDLGGLSASPKNIDSFCGMFVNMVFAIAGQFKGACLYKDQELIINNRVTKVKDFVESFTLNKKFISDGNLWEYAELTDEYRITEENREVLISKVYRRPYKNKIYKISTKTGLSAQTSKDHKFKVLRKGKIEEVTAENLHLYDTVFVDSNLGYMVDTESYEYKRNFILGMLLGDGNLTKEHCVGLSVNYDQEYYLDIFNTYSREIFGFTLNKNKGHKCWNAQKRNAEYKNNIMQYLEGNDTFNKNIKSKYLNSINECAGFLDGLMSADGADRHSFGISLVNEPLINSCKIALEKLNVHYSFSVTPKHDNKSELYNLSFNSYSYVYLPNFCKKLKREINRDFYYYRSNHVKKTSKNDLDLIDSSKRDKSFYRNYHVDVITSIETFDNDDDFVYEIETSSHWYSCGGIITHNCATPSVLNCFDYFCRKEWGDYYHTKLDVEISSIHCLNKKTIRKQIHQYFQQIVYSLMQPSGSRSSQACFWNLSIFDKTFFDSMYSDFKFPDGTPANWDSLCWLQKEFVSWLNEERLKCILTFPVVSVCLIYQDGKFLDEDLYEFVCSEYAKGNSFFTYISDSADSLSSCCRLSSKLAKPQFNFTNGQLSEMTGSKNVITLNINRITQDFVNSIAEKGITTLDGEFDKKVDTSEKAINMVRDSIITRIKYNGWPNGKNLFKQYIVTILDRIYKYQIAYNECLIDLYNARMLSVYDAGFIDLKKQYLTIGINGLNQAAEYLGIQCNNNAEYKDFCTLIFTTIKEQNQLHKTKDVMFNTECTP